jgi:hypothetical protein
MSPSLLSSKHPTPPRPLYALLRPSRIGPGLAPTLLLLGRLVGISRLCGCFYGGYLARELGLDGIVPPTLLSSGFPLGVQLLPKVSNLVLQRGDEFGLATWYAPDVPSPNRTNTVPLSFVVGRVPRLIRLRTAPSVMTNAAAAWAPVRRSWFACGSPVWPSPTRGMLDH